MPYSFIQFKKRLIKLGYKIVRQKGSHVIFSDGHKTFPVPKHGGDEISPGVEKIILEIIGYTKEEFKNIK